MPWEPIPIVADAERGATTIVLASPVVAGDLLAIGYPNGLAVSHTARAVKGRGPYSVALDRPLAISVVRSKGAQAAVLRKSGETP